MLRLGLCGIGLVKASRGEGRGEAKGEAVDERTRGNGAVVPPLPTKPCDETGLAPGRAGEAAGVMARGICHGAGEPRRSCEVLVGGDTGGGGGTVASRYRQSTPRMASSSGRPSSAVSFRSSSSSLSVFSSSSRPSSLSIGWHRS